MDDLDFAPDDPRAPDVRALLERHLGFAAVTSPPEHVHALDVEGLTDPSVAFFSVRRDGVLLGVAALKRLDATHAEIKSMHVPQEARRRRIGATLLDRLLVEAGRRGFTRVSLETGRMEAFAAARALYVAAGFVECPPFAEYSDNEYSVCMTRSLAGDAPA